MLHKKHSIKETLHWISILNQLEEIRFLGDTSPNVSYIYVIQGDTPLDIMLKNCMSCLENKFIKPHLHENK